MDDLSTFYVGKRVLVTGGLGFIGRNLAHALIDCNAIVTIVDSRLSQTDLDEDCETRIRDRVAIYTVDLRDQPQIRDLVSKQDLIFNLVGQVSHINSMRDPFHDLEINCRCQLSLLECCREANPDVRIVHASTRQIYGRPQYLPVDEQHPLAPVDINGINKLAAELYFQLYSRVYSMESVCLRLTNTYGPRMDLANPHNGFIGVFLRQALLGEKISVFGTGEQRRDFNFVSDVVEAMLRAGACNQMVGRSFNLGSDEHFTIKEFLETLRSLLKIDYEVIPFPDEHKAIDIGDYVGDFSSFQRLSGWRPRVGLLAGLTSTIEYFRTNPSLVVPHSITQLCRTAVTS
jgi:nucleoside-diphosphate-sugar epimerase